MNVSQLESALGMTRANIRFYEKEGLLSPARSENGYRDYSDRDLETLRRIKLLRALRFSLEDIRALQSGELDLSAALRARREALRREAADLEAAQALCRTMEDECVRYADLDAARYLSEMERLERDGARFRSVEADSLPTVRHPWRRFFARSLDHGLCHVLLLAALSLLFRTRPGDGLLWDLLLLYLAWGIQFLLEPLLLSTWGATPGKWLFGLEVRAAGGGKLTFSQAFSRLALLFGRGEGYGIPLYSLYRNYKCFRICDEGEPLPWEEGLSYAIRDLKAVRCAAYAAAEAARLALVVLLALHLLMPPVRRPLTVADFARNYNDICRQYDLSAYYLLDGEGRWTESSQGYRLGGGPPPALTYSLEDGRLTGLSFTTRRAPDFFSGASVNETALLLALLPAQPGVGLINWPSVLREMEEKTGSPLEDYTVSLYGLTVTNSVEYSGYRDMGMGYLLPVEGQEQTYRQAFTVRIDTGL